MIRRPPPDPAAPAGIYLHFPFCAIRCSYCDFPTVAGRDERIEAYLEALVRELEAGQRELPRRIDSVYLGGGTPSRMSPSQLGRVLDAVRRRFELAGDTEITVEANPESLTPELLRGYRGAGVTRLSIGVQSLDDEVLESVGRAHDAPRALAAVRDAVAAGVERVGVDLIAGLPGERLEGWEETVRRVARLGTGHVSVYLLESDKDTPLSRAVRHGRVRVADDDRIAESYRRTVETLTAHGLPPYEISNFARPGHRSRHNLKYWSDVPYGGFGLGAHGYAAGERRANRRDLDGYIDDALAGRDPVQSLDPWDPRRRLEEAMMLGLRRVEGIDLARLGGRYGTDAFADYRAAWERALEAGVLERHGTRLCLTPEGRLRSNELFAELLTV